MLFFSSFFFHTSTFQLLDKPWSQMSSFLPPGSCLQFFIAHRVDSAIPLLVHFSSSVANSRFRIFRESICAQEKPLYTSMHSGGFELAKLPIPGSTITRYATGATDAISLRRCRMAPGIAGWANPLHQQYGLLCVVDAAIVTILVVFSPLKPQRVDTMLSKNVRGRSSKGRRPAGKTVKPIVPH